MKLSLSTLACPAWPIERIIMMAAEHGIRGIDFRGLGAEIDITRLVAFTVELPRTIGLLRKAELSMPCISTSVTLLAPTGEMWNSMIEECHRYAELAAGANTPFLRIFGGRVPKVMSRAQALLTARRRLRQLIKICRPLGCRPLVETHDDWCVASEMIELLGDSEPGDTGVVWDMEHTTRRGEEPAQTVRGLGDFLHYVHIKDTLRIGDRMTPRLLGEGDLPLRACLRALLNANYHGWICLDTEKRWFADAPEAEQSIPHFAAYMRKAFGSVHA